MQLGLVLNSSTSRAHLARSASVWTRLNLAQQSEPQRNAPWPACSMADEWKPNPLTGCTDENGRCGFRGKRRSDLDLCNRHLRNDQDVDDLVDELRLGNLQKVLWTVRTMGTCRCTTTGMSPTVSKIWNYWDLHGFPHSLPSFCNAVDVFDGR